MELFKLFGTIAINNDGANSAIDETTGVAEGAESKMSSAFKKIGAAVAAAFAIDKIIAFGKSITEAAATVAAEQSAFEQIMGEYSDAAQQKVNEIADATGMVATRLTPYMTSMTAKFKGLGYDIDDATTLAQGGLTLAADAAAFWDKSLEDSMSALNSFINGSYEGGEAIGLFANDTQMAQYAIEQGLVETTAAWANLDEATKQATRLEYAQAMFEASGAVGQAAKESEQYANIQANLTEKWRQFKAQIGEPLLQNVVIPAMDKLSSVVDIAAQKFDQLKAWISDNQTELQNLGNTLTTIAGIVAVAAAAFVGLKTGMMIQSTVQGFQSAQVAVSLLTMEVGKANLAQAALNGTMTIGQTIVALLTGKMTLAALAQGVMTKAQAALNAVMAANPIALVVMAIAALIAIFVVLWTKCEWFRNFWIGLWEGIKVAAQAVANWIVQAWTGIGNFFATTVPGWFTAVANFFVSIWTSITSFLSSAWETIKNVVQVGIMFISAILQAAFDLITLPFRLIWENCKDTIMMVWNAIVEFLTSIFNTVATFVSDTFNSIKDKITTVFNAVKNFITTVWNAIKAFLEPLLTGIRNTFTTVWNGIKTVTTTVFNAIKDFVTNVWNGIKTSVTNIITGIKTSITNVFNSIKSTVTNIFNSIKSTATSVWNGVKTAIETPINKARDIVKKALDKIKSFFDGLKLKFPNIKLPHFKIAGSFSLSPPSVPKLTIDWYKKAMNNAMLLNSPTIFGMNPAGQLMGAGEAGEEIVAGSKTLMGMIRNSVKAENSIIAYYLEKLISMLAVYFPEILSNMGNDIVLDGGVLVGRLAPRLDKTLGDINDLRKRGK